MAVAMKLVLVLIGAVLVAIGTAALIFPDLLAAGFGIPIGTAASRAYVIATGTRDVAMGCWLLALVRLRASNRVVAASLFALALVAAGDAINVSTYCGTRGSLALVAHTSGLVVLLSLGILMWRRKDARPTD